MTKVKVCGITGFEDAVMALELGADALGFNFHPPSPRYIRPAEAAAIIRRLPPFAVTVGVFVNLPADAVARAAEASGVGVLQLHGDETPGTCRALARWPLVKALRLRPTASSRSSSASRPWRTRSRSSAASRAATRRTTR